MSHRLRKRLLPALTVLMAWLLAGTCRMALAEYVPGEVLVTYETNPIVAEAEGAVAPEQAIGDLGFDVAEELSRDGEEATVVASVPAGTSVEEAVEELNGLAGVEAQPNYVYHLIEPALVDQAYEVLVRPGDENSISGWKSLQKNLAAAQVFDAWDLAISNHTISAAVIDTGCWLKHPALAGNILTNYAWDYTRGPAGTGQSLTLDTANGGDDQGHGTHVCGILAANGTGIKGASYDADIIPVKVLDSTGYGETADIACAISYIVGLKTSGTVPSLRVINLSLGGGEEANDLLMKKAMDTATLNGILCVCSAGNSAVSTPLYPSDYDNALSVMALEENGYFASYSDYNEHKDIAAVGTAYSCYPRAENEGKFYTKLSGTSMAAPLVSGVACLVWSVNPSLSAAQVRDVIMATAHAVPDGGSNKFHADASARVPQVNALDAVRKAQELYGSMPVVQKVAKPQSITEVTYDGLPHTCAATGVGYVLEGDATKTDAGAYTATAKLQEGYEWDDGSKTDITYTWRIVKAPLTIAYKNSHVAKSYDGVPPQELEYQGLVNGETEAALVEAERLQKPTVQFPAGIGTARAYNPGVYVVTLSGGSATNYEITLAQTGKLVVVDDGSNVYSIPQATTTYEYNGSKQRLQLSIQGDTSFFTLGGTYEATDACPATITWEDSGTRRNVSYTPYVATLTLKNAGDRWEDGSTEISIPWTIKQVPLSLSYVESWMPVGGAVPAKVPANVKVEGFKGADTIDKLMNTGDVDGKRLKLPRIVKEDLAEIAENDLAKPGDLQVVPYLLDQDACATRNYAFQEAKVALLHVCAVVSAPQGKTLTFTGSSQRGVDTGEGYALLGTPVATNAGSYMARANLSTNNYMWQDGTRGQKGVSWRIVPASLSGASMSAIPTQTYTGGLISPKPTVTWNGRTLREGTDYTLSYANNRAQGTARVTATGKGNFTGTCSATFAIRRPAVVSYRTHVQTYGWQGWKVNGAVSGTSGQAKRLEGIEIRLEGAPYAGGVQYRTHVQTHGWQGWRADGAMSGTSGQAKRLEAIEIRLTGEMARHYDVWYRVHAQTYGWMGWASNGARAGTATMAKRLEGIQVVLVAKGAAGPGASFGGVTQRGSSAYATRSVQYRTHVQTYGWQGWRYDGETSGTSGQAKRLEGINIRLSDPLYSGGVQYRTHVQTHGWQGWRADGAMSGTSGQAKRLEAIEIRLTGEMAARYDVWYRVHAQTFGWMGWASNGAPAGTAGHAKRLEAIQIRLVPKGGAAPGSTANAFRQK